MTPEQLKASILQYAIQGKLVEQRPEEGTGEELYRQIQVEKQRLIHEGKIKKEKPLAAIAEDEIPFDIPESWKWVRLGDIYSLTMGQSPDGKSVTKNSDGTDGVEFHQGKVFFGNDYIQKSDQVTSAPSKIAEPNSVLLCVRAPVGIVNITDRELCIGRGLCAIKSLAGMTEKYTLYSLRCLKDEFIKKASGTTFVAITGETVKNQLIPLPPLAEQHRIVTKIEELLPLVDRYAASYEKLEQFNTKFPEDMKKSILQYAIQGKLVEQRPEEGTGEELYRQIQAEERDLLKSGVIKAEKPFEKISDNEKAFDIPENWTWVRFGQLGRYKKGPFGSALTKSIFVPKSQNTVKVYEQKNAIQKDATLGDYYITREYFERKMQGFEVFPGDIIVSCAGTIGETYVMPDNMEQGIINQALMRMKLFRPIYIPYFLIFFEVVLKKSAQSGSKGSAIKNIPPFDVLKNYPVPLPPLAEQKRIVAKIEELLPLCERLK